MLCIWFAFLGAVIGADSVDDASASRILHGGGHDSEQPQEAFWWWMAKSEFHDDRSRESNEHVEDKNFVQALHREHLESAHIWELGAGGTCPDFSSTGPEDANVEILLGNLPASTANLPVHLHWWAARKSQHPYSVMREVYMADVYDSAQNAYPRYDTGTFNGGNVRIDENGIATIRIRTPATYFGPGKDASNNRDMVNDHSLRGWWDHVQSYISGSFRNNSEIRLPHIHLRLCANNSALARTDKIIFSYERPFVKGGGCGWGLSNWSSEPYQILSVQDSTTSRLQDRSCPWLQQTNGEALHCMDGSYCVPRLEGWSCCSERGGRERCPASHPVMCNNKKCYDDHCCGAFPFACGHNGPRGCPALNGTCDCLKVQDPEIGTVDAVCKDHLGKFDPHGFKWCYVPLNAACDALPYESTHVPGLGWKICNHEFKQGHCVDYNWTDAEFNTCADYHSEGWCTHEGGLGFGWHIGWGTLSDYVFMGRHAGQACCACGGGDNSSYEQEVATSDVGDEMNLVLDETLFNLTRNNSQSGQDMTQTDGEGGVTEVTDAEGPDWDVLEFSPVYRCLEEALVYSAFASDCVAQCSPDEDLMFGQCVRPNVSDAPVAFRVIWSIDTSCGVACWDAKQEQSLHFVRLGMADHLDIPFEEVYSVKFQHLDSRRLAAGDAVVTEGRLDINVSTKRLTQEQGDGLVKSFLASSTEASEILGIPVHTVERVLSQSTRQVTSESVDLDDPYAPYYERLAPAPAAASNTAHSDTMGGVPTNANDLPSWVIIGGAITLVVIGVAVFVTWRLRKYYKGQALPVDDNTVAGRALGMVIGSSEIASSGKQKQMDNGLGVDDVPVGDVETNPNPKVVL